MILRNAAILTVGMVAATLATPALARPDAVGHRGAGAGRTTGQGLGHRQAFDGLHKWHPAFAGDEITKGKNNEKGAVRVLTLKEGGGKITEELLAWTPGA